MYICIEREKEFGDKRQILEGKRKIGSENECKKGEILRIKSKWQTFLILFRILYASNNQFNNNKYLV